MSSYYIGIDPGLSGAAALLDNKGKFVDLVDLPIMASGKSGSKCINAKALYDMLTVWAQHDPIEVWIEQVGSRPGNAAAAMFSFGSTFGSIKAVCSCVGLRMNFVTPAAWKNSLKLTKTAKMTKDQHKELSRALALNLFPEASGFLNRKKDHDRAEALLLAYYGSKQ